MRKYLRVRIVVPLLTMLSLLAGGLALAAAGSASAAPAVPAVKAAIPPGYTEVGGLDEAGYCASATPGMTAVIDSNNVGWDCTLTVQLPGRTTRTLAFEINQTLACDAQYPADAGTVGAIRIPASPPAYGWVCVVPTA